MDSGTIVQGAACSVVAVITDTGLAFFSKLYTKLLKVKVNGDISIFNKVSALYASNKVCFIWVCISTKNTYIQKD